MTPLMSSKDVLAFCFEQKAVLVGVATKQPLSAKDLIFVFPSHGRKHSPPGVTSAFVKDLINRFYPHLHPTFKEHHASLPAQFQVRGASLTKTVHFHESDLQWRLDHHQQSFCFSYSRVWKGSSVREIFESPVYVNSDFS